MSSKELVPLLALFAAMHLSSLLIVVVAFCSVWPRHTSRKWGRDCMGNRHDETAEIVGSIFVKGPKGGESNAL